MQSIRVRLVNVKGIRYVPRVLIGTKGELRFDLTGSATFFSDTGGNWITIEKKRMVQEDDVVLVTSLDNTFEFKVLKDLPSLESRL